MKIGDLCAYAPKSAIKAGEAVIGGAYSFFTSSSDEGKRYSDYQLNCEAIIMGTGGNATLHYYNGKFATSTDCVVLLPNNAVRCKYLYYFLLCNMALLEAGFKGAGLKHTNKKYIDSIEVPAIPSLKEQDEVIEILDKTKAIIKSREQELQKLDELVKARFVEMFGTLEEPTHEFSRATLKELCNKITDGKHGGCTTESGTERYFVGAREIYDDEVHYETAPEINAAEFEKDYKRCNVEIGDFLIVNTGATIGKSAIASDERTTHTLLQKSVALLKVKKDVLDPIFLKWCYRVNTGMYMVKSASAQPNLLLSKINATEIYVPDIRLQKQFTAFVKQTDKSKVVVQKALDEAQTLFDSLMQEYFG